AWRPGKFTASQQVKVQVKDTLTCIGTHIGDKTIAALGKPKLLGQSGCNHEQDCQYMPILFSQISHRCDMPSRDEQDMMRCLRINILKSNHILILVNNFTRYLTFCNFAEQ